MDSLPQILRELLKQPRPEVLNFQVNDICNARCVMCNIWKNKRSRELSPDEFATVLRNPFFQEVQHVGITGGEPTLRGDLPRFYEALISTLPRLTGASFITNGFKSSEAIAAYTEVHRAYSAVGKQFTGMVSLDGVGEIHDRVRGRAGSFAKATATLFGLRAAGVDVHAACTIVKSNVWHVDELLDWGRRNGVYIRFRIGEFIRRLYNLNARQEIRAFNEAEIKHLVSFFHKLILDYEKEARIRLTYESILSILTGGERLTTCPYQTTRAINLDSEGRFAICAPCGQPTPLGGNPERKARRIFERLRTRVRSCPKCIHDYHGNPTPREEERRNAAQLAAHQLAAAPNLTRLPTAPIRPLKNVLIIGWYGSETAGDIAIFGGLLEQYRTRGAMDFTVLSLYPTYSRVTLPPVAKEIGVRLKVCSYDDAEVLGRLDRFDAVSLGGGPLMDIDPTELVRNIFRSARARGVRCHIDGCGIGPLHQPRFRTVIADILSLASEIRLRDQESADAARQLAESVQTAVILDPSATYIRRLGIRWRTPTAKVIRCWLRMLTHEYAQDTNSAEATDLVEDLLRRILNWYPDHQIELGAMHFFPVGWDDREFSRLLAARINSPRLVADIVPRTPKEILERMAESEFNLCMRFHSVVFAHMIGAPYLPLDYTAGGKIASFLRKHGIDERAVQYSKIPALNQNNFRDHLCVAMSQAQ